MGIKSLRHLCWAASLPWLVTAGAAAQDGEPVSVAPSCEPDFEREWNHHELSLAFIAAINARDPGAIGKYIRPGAAVQEITSGIAVPLEQGVGGTDDFHLEVVGTLDGGHNVVLSLHDTRDSAQNMLLLLTFTGGCINGAAYAS